MQPAAEDGGSFPRVVLCQPMSVAAVGLVDVHAAEDAICCGENRRGCGNGAEVSRGGSGRATREGNFPGIVIRANALCLPGFVVGQAPSSPRMGAAFCWR